MVTVTDTAKRELKRTMERTSLNSEKFLRLATPPVWTGDGDFGIVVDSKSDVDQEVVLDGLVVLLIDDELAKHLAKSTLDFIESTEGPKFNLDVF
jgi:Fe-S cluster assembly iron-binding protein IscA